MVVYITQSHAYAVVEVDDISTGHIVHSVREVIAFQPETQWKTIYIARGFQSHVRACRRADELEHADLVSDEINQDFWPDKL